MRNIDIKGFTEEEDRMLGLIAEEEEQEVADLIDYSEWRWVPIPPSKGMCAAARNHWGNIPEMLEAAMRAAPKPWLED